MKTNTLNASNKHLMKETVHLSFGEEVGNAISHGVMMAIDLLAMPPLCVYAYLHQGWLGCAGMGVYLICMICMFGGSCLYHIMPYDTPWKTVFRKLDHISIFLAIAGTYTPICLRFFKGWVGWTRLALEWGLAICGIVMKSVSKYSHPVVSMILYLAMGWLALLVIPTAWKQCGPTFVYLLLAGGICNTIATFFYSRKKPYDHFIWHLFIALAALCHLSAILICL